MPIGETYLNINGRIATEPTRRELDDGGESLGFLVISTERRFDKETGKWVDGHKCSVWVTCWRRLARHVGVSLRKGDEVMVAGRLRTREYDDDGATRCVTEVDAYAVGPNLARATATVVRVRAGTHVAGAPEASPAPETREQPRVAPEPCSAGVVRDAA
ncbi:single-stranded DNA-binding protein [Haloechinothrix salitolerans]|uniref:Single-stranded DNA-binding protein n=1 Tax=Haloechinothrix salitolerans TaxID=926830 RepID=A0ABW2C6J1_9PSEU